MSHGLDDHERSAVTHHVFANARGARSPHFIVDIEAATNDRGVANSPRNLVTPTTGTASSENVSFGIDPDHGDRIVILFVDFWNRLLFLPLFPLCFL